MYICLHVYIYADLVDCMYYTYMYGCARVLHTHTYIHTRAHLVFYTYIYGCAYVLQWHTHIHVHIHVIWYSASLTLPRQRNTPALNDLGVCKCIHIYIQLVDMRKCIHIHILTGTHIQIHVYIHRKQPNPHIHVRRTQTYTRIFWQTLTYTHVHIYPHIHIPHKPAHTYLPTHTSTACAVRWSNYFVKTQLWGCRYVCMLIL